MTPTYTLTSIAHAVEIATTVSQSWFRGHARVYGELTPKVFRQPYSTPTYRGLRPDIELDFIEQFRRNAPTLAVGHSLPHDDDNLGWLCLTQHYGAPTRLLDWTESALVALWFAVNGHPDKDGELWAMYPKGLNERTPIGPGIPILGFSKVIDFLAKEPYWRGDPKQLAKTLSLLKPVTRPVAFKPRRAFPRTVAQSSAFTIHPRPTEGNTMPELLTDPKVLVRWIVPAGRKKELKDKLIALGPTFRTSGL